MRTSPRSIVRRLSREVLDVAFPDENAAYFSLDTYGTDLDTTDTRDDQILPGPGTGNPFSDPGAQGLPPDRRRCHADPAATMGAHSPVVAYCSAATSAARGYAGCVEGDR
ncbi:hypothetical protein [Prescottella agglutinans]|uniref:hypothetical protein n=1 Tax=Prescottella agglutinans TaxID=1644129 RepID=UPI003D96CEA3